MQVKIDFIVPTLKRPEHLRRCLNAIRCQSGCVPRAVVGVRHDDHQSREICNELRSVMTIVVADAVGVGVIGSMNSCLRSCEADYVGLVDDDVELPPFWASVMLRHLNSDCTIVGASGRDILLDDPEMRRAEPLLEDVGRIHFYGRITGNHHRAGGQPRRVDVLRGSNCLYRSNFLLRHGFEKSLAGAGAQVNWELALALQARLESKQVFFDPTVEVLHHVATRYDNDTVHRGVFNADATADIAHNETLVTLKHGRGITRLMLILWQVSIGSEICPGFVRVLLKPKSRLPLLPRLKSTMRGRSRAVYSLLTRARLADQPKHSALPDIHGYRPLQSGACNRCDSDIQIPDTPEI